MAEKIGPGGRKIHDMPDPEQGQGFLHDVPSGMNWEKVLDQIHYVMLNKWYYVAIATNTTGGIFNTPMENQISVRRKKRKVPEELQSLLKLRSATFRKLSQKIQQQQRQQGDKDVWHFKGQWEEFPSGTCIIELKQKPGFSMFRENINYRKAYIILDGQAEVEQQNNTMMLINRILTNQKYVKKLEEKMAKHPAKEVAVRERPKTGIYEGRPVGELVIKLKESFNVTIRSLSIDEKAALSIYFKNLNEKGELNKEHEALKKKVDEYFSKDFTERE